jgi:hypothetical protein
MEYRKTSMPVFSNQGPGFVRLVPEAQYCTDEKDNTSLCVGFVSGLFSERTHRQPDGRRLRLHRFVDAIFQVLGLLIHDCGSSRFGRAGPFSSGPAQKRHILHRLHGCHLQHHECRCRNDPAGEEHANDPIETGDGRQAEPLLLLG